MSLPFLIGEKRFTDWVKETFFKGRIDHNIPQSKNLAPSKHEIINMVCTYYRVDEQEIHILRRGKESLPRDVAMYLMRSIGGERLLGIGEVMGLRSYSSVSTAVNRIKKKLPTNKKLEEDIRIIREMIIRGQTKT
jgi:chromosomal replication initiation ATPase DnaA